jgi:hypothetical protein
MAHVSVQGKSVPRQLLALLALSFSLVAGRASGGESPVVLGNVNGSTPGGEFRAPLRNAVREALDATKLGRARERFVLSATLVTLDARQTGRSVSATAVVSLVLRHEKEQTLHALLRGSATAEDSDSTLASTRETALRAAVRSAMRRLPEAVGQKGD